MPTAYISGSLYKGLFFLLLVFILLEYFFGTITDSKSFIFFNTTTKSRNHQDTESLHGPLFKALLLKHNNNSSVKNLTVSNINKTLATSTNTPILMHSSNTYLTVAALFDSNTSEELDNSTNIKAANTTTTPPCPDISPNLRGKIPVVKNPVPTVNQLESTFSWLKPGGHWYPDTCKVEKKVAIIIPFRCRGEHLLLFLQHMHPFLKRQLLDYTIFIIEQDGDGPFNRAMLMNVGYKEALKSRNYDCFIFHDIDLLPEDDRNLYTCPQQPRHMSVAVDIFKYRLPYRDIFGGVSAISREHFKLLNGFSNAFWGWGGEDDDMSNRIKHHHLFISRYPINIARYTMLTHKKDKPSPNRYDVLKQGRDRYEKDGLNNLKYRIVQTKNNLLYTWLLVGVDTPS